MRALLALLLLANLGFFALTQGWLAPFFVLPAPYLREPQRLAAQLNAPSVRLLGAPPASSLALVAETAPACLQAGPFSAEQIDSAETWLAQLPAPAPDWRRLRTEVTGTWRVVLARFSDPASLARRQEDLRRQGFEVEDGAAAGASPAELSIGRFDDKAAADAALVRMQQRGWSNARLSPPSVTPQYWLRIDRADAAQRERLLGLLPALPGASGFGPCPKPG
jgi:hypothetical protein